MKKVTTLTGLLMATALTPAFSPVRADDTTDKPKQPVEDIVVTASPIAGSSDRFATIVGQVNRDQILKNGGSNIADALGNTPGVTGTGFAAGASRPVIRGFDSNRVRVLEDGVGSFDVSEVGPDHGVPIDPLAIQKIEVVRGAATLRYGSQAIGGVVNTINNRVPLHLGDEPFTGEFSGAYGTGSKTGQGSLLMDATLGQVAFHADGFYRHTGDYKIPGGTMPNSYFHGGGFSGGASYFFGDSRVGGAVIHYDTNYGIPGEDVHIEMKQTKELFGSSLAINKGLLKTININAGHADYTHSEINNGDGTVNSTFNDKEWDSRAEFLFDAIGPLSSAAAGVQFQHRNFEALGEGANYLLPTLTKSAAVFLFTEMPVGDRLNLQAGARVEHVSIDGTPLSGIPTSRNFTPVSASIGGLYDLTDSVKIGLTASSTARAPAQTELFARGPHDGPLTYETGDPTLGMERGNSLEATLRYKADSFHFEGSAWLVSFNDFIYGRLTGQKCDDAGVCSTGGSGTLKEMFYEARGATFRGLEGKVTKQLMTTEEGGLSAVLLGDYVRATLKNGGGNVPRIPPFHITGGMDYESDIMDAGVRVKYTGAQNNVPVGDTTTRGYWSVDMTVSLRPFDSMPNTELSLIAHNLTNTEQHNAIALNKDEVTLPGRDIRFNIRTTF
ncbi:TonB-dependent receptor [Kordiimonas marina]|uniref:TonB-dependent receptor n=1 Tax=Kordiimonas marina TaxID=2872312 RepID=UPI001FF5D426|nr:TonB-dependent receptor [Kordiimonas marina]MCJ9430695.1 TonB-dependent receptor [Kordiimonas marina]